MRTSALKKVAAGLVLALPVLLVLDFLQYQSVHIVAGTHRMVVRSNELLRESSALQGQLKDAEAAVREYIVSGETVALDPFETTEEAVRETLARLMALVENEPEQKARAQKLEPIITRRIELLKQEVSVRNQKGFTIGRTRPLETEGRKISEAIQTLAGEIEKAETDTLKRRNEAARASVQRATFITPFAAILGLWLVALAALLLYRDASEKKWTGIERRMHTRLLEALPVGVFMVDESDLIFYANPAHEALFGYDSGDLIGRHASILQAASRGDADHPFARISEEITLHGNWAGELECRKKDGTTFSCLVQGKILDLPGKVYRVFVLQDLTGQPRA